MEDLIKALLIFQKYSNDEYPTACEHDVLYVNVDPAVVSQGDKAELDELGFIPEDGYFSSYKYGSC